MNSKTLQLIIRYPRFQNISYPIPVSIEYDASLESLNHGIVIKNPEEVDATEINTILTIFVKDPYLNPRLLRGILIEKHGLYRWYASNKEVLDSKKRIALIELTQYHNALQSATRIEQSSRRALWCKRLEYVVMVSSVATFTYLFLRLIFSSS